MLSDLTQSQYAMPKRGRHQSTSKECQDLIRRIEAMDGVIGVIIGRSYGGKSLGSHSHTGSMRVQRVSSGGIKAVMQSSKGLQEIFIRVEDASMNGIAEKLSQLA